MARQSRNELFKASFAEFINILEEAHEYNIHDWTCNCTTTNKRRIVHKYMFKIPVKRVLYEIDIPYLENGVWNQPGPVYESQVLPTKELFYSLFIDYYSPFYLELTNNTMLSYVEYTQFVIDENNGLTCEIHVIYNKSHIPYPISVMPNSHREVRLLSKIQVLNEEIKEHNNTICELNTDINILIKKKNKQNSIIDKLKAKLKEEYSKRAMFDDCPVCYEKIETNTLNISNCCHYVCNECIGRCTKCPLCREKL